jgi:hypothetical protein
MKGTDMRKLVTMIPPLTLFSLGCSRASAPGRGGEQDAPQPDNAERSPRVEVKPYNIRTTIISPDAVATELPSHITDETSAAGIQKFYEGYAIPADSFARAVAFAISQPEDVDVNEILFRPTRQEL